MLRVDSLLVGDTVTVRAMDGNGSAIKASRVAWTSASNGPIHVTADGVVVALEKGAGVVVADVGGVKDSAEIRATTPDDGWADIGIICGRRYDRHVWCWSRSPEGTLYGLTVQLPFTNVAAYYPGPNARHYSCLLDTDGSAFCRGHNFMGQLGTGDTNDRLDFTPVTGQTRFRQLSLGSTHACGVAVDGDVLCWGSNWTGQLGTSGGDALCRRTRTVPCQRSPVRVTLPGRAVAVTADGGINQEGDGFSCAILSGGPVYCWGDNSWGQVARARTATMFAQPQLVSESILFRRIDAGNAHVCGIDVAYQIWCWGFGNGGLGTRLPGSPEFECGFDVVFACTSVPVRANTTQRFRELAASYNVTCAISLFGAAYCWGDNRFGQVGTGRKGATTAATSSIRHP